MQIVDVTAPGTPESYSEVAAAAASSFCEFFCSACALVETVYIYGSCADSFCGCCISYVGWRCYYIVRS
ncbi:BnaA09g42700D [Brassica napus]|uniref:BnaA09g42700D protein n=1 Tax=Brassica napus TaxID=3708 RepID=A0A078FN27_BRANA|nr:BnaA09g42700D [Brassica napus]